MGNLFGFLSGSPEQALLKACQANDVQGARQTLAKMFPNAERDVHGKLDSIKDEEGKNPLMVAARYGAVECIQILLQAGASPDARHFMQSTTALHYAAGWGQPNAIVTLLDAGADPTAVSASGFTPMDLARQHRHGQAVRALEKRMALFYGWLKWERSTMIQAGLGKMLGAQVKEAMRGKFGGEWRDCWVSVTKLSGKASNIMMCPRCKGQFSDGRDPGTKVNCPNCRSELHIPQTSMVTILELAVYETFQDARPEIAFPLTVVSVENEFRIPETNMWAARIYVQRPPEVSSGGKHGKLDQSKYGLVDDSGKNLLWGQSVLTTRPNENRSIKKIVFGVNGEDQSSRQLLGRFADALRSAPMNAVMFSALAKSQGGMQGVTLAPAAPNFSTMAVSRPPPPPPRTRPPVAVRLDDDDGIVQVSLGPDWTCPTCTLQNPGSAQRCDACDTPRDASPLEVARVRNAQQRSPSPTAKSTAPAPTRTQQAFPLEANVVAPPPIEEIEVLDPDEIPAHFICPLTHQVMEDPVVTVDGLSYERRAIVAHFAEHGAMSPVTMMPLESTMVAPNIALRRAIEEWRSSIPVASIAVI